MVNKWWTNPARENQQEIPIPTASFSSSVDSWPALSLSVEMDLKFFEFGSPKSSQSWDMLGVWDYLGLFGTTLSILSVVSRCFKGFIIPERTLKIASPGATTRWSLGGQMIRCWWFLQHQICIIQVAIYVWSKWTKQKTWPKRTENFKKGMSENHTSKCLQTVRLAYIFGRLFHFTILLLRLLLLPGLGQHWKFRPLNPWNPWNPYGTKKGSSSRHRWSQMLGSQLIQLIHPWYHKNS